MKKIVVILLLLSLLTLLFSCYKDENVGTENGGDSAVVPPPADDNDDPAGDVNPPATEPKPDLWADYINDPNDSYMGGGTVVNHPFGEDIKTEPVPTDKSMEFSLSTIYFATMGYILTYDIRIENGVLFVDDGGNGDYVEIGELVYTEDVTFFGNDTFYDLFDSKASLSGQSQPYTILHAWEALYRVHRASTAYTAIIPGQSSNSLAYWRIYVFEGVYYALYLADGDDGVTNVMYFGTSTSWENYADPVPFDEDIKTELFSTDETYTAVTYGYKNSSSTEIIAYNIKIADGVLYVKPADSNGEYYKWGSLTLKHPPWI